MSEVTVIELGQEGEEIVGPMAGLSLSEQGGDLPLEFQFDDTQYKTKSGFNYGKFLVRQGVPIHCATQLTKNDHLAFDELVMNVSNFGTLTPSGKYVDTPARITVELKPHQKRTLFEMVQRETFESRLIKENIHYLCDNVGSGKSLCMLSLIALHPKVTSMSRNNYSSIYEVEDWRMDGFEVNPTTEFRSNLIVVPHGIISQWKAYIVDQTTMTVFVIGCQRDLDKLKRETLDEHDIILVKSTFYGELVRKMKNLGLNQSTSYDFVTEAALTNKRKTIDLLKSITETFINKASKGEYNYDYIFSELKTIQEMQTKLANQSDDANLFPCEYIKKVTGCVFQRVIFDEADSIKISGSEIMYGKQNWLITSSVNNLFFPKGRNLFNNNVGRYQVVANGINGCSFICLLQRSLLAERESRCRPLLCVVRHHPDFIRDSIEVPDPMTEYIACLTPTHLQILKGTISQDAIQALNAGDMESAIQLLGCPKATEGTLVQMVCGTFYDRLKELEAIIQDKRNNIQHNASEQARLTGIVATMPLSHPDYEDVKAEIKHLKSLARSYESSIENFSHQVIEVKAKIQGIEDRVKDVNKKTCPICVSELEKPAVTPCCRNVFCFQCLTLSLNTKKECPMCRTKIELNELSVIVGNETTETTEPKPEDKPTLLPKIQVLIDYLKEKPNRRFLVFSSFENTFHEIGTKMNEYGITFAQINGTAMRINKIIREYQQGKIQVLLLNAKNFGAGLNLQITDEILIYHRMSKDLERQVVGRAQRLGRKEPLMIRYLCYENEYPSA